MHMTNRERIADFLYDNGPADTAAIVSGTGLSHGNVTGMLSSMFRGGYLKSEAGVNETGHRTIWTLIRKEHTS